MEHGRSESHSTDFQSSNHHGRSYSYGSTPHGYYASGSHHDATTSSRAAVGVQRDTHGRIKRSETAKKEFMRMTGHPNGWPGHVVDHIIALKHGGPDSPSNMQWQTIEEAKAKDKWE
ncbi:MAG: HNH endonuclease signature motif containing protein [Thermoguttaceae bacterium]